jgi:hypothetical protein
MRVQPAPGSSRRDVTADQRREFVRAMQQIERREIVPAAGVIAPAFAGPKQDPGIRGSSPWPGMIV